jgi:hypothetical protein
VDPIFLLRCKRDGPHFGKATVKATRLFWTENLDAVRRRNHLTDMALKKDRNDIQSETNDRFRISGGSDNLFQPNWKQSKP